MARAVGPLHRFRIDDLPREPWRNGAGWTRSVCSREVDGQPWWRVSVADITAAGPFSRFEGMDRIAVMLSGGGLCLSNADVRLAFDGPGSVVQFPGEWTLQCDAPALPTQLFNIMARRDSAGVRVLLVADEPLALPPGGHQVALALRGRFELVPPAGARHILGAGEGVHWQSQDAGWCSAQIGGGGAMVWCALP